MKKIISLCLAAASFAPCTVNATLPWLYENPRIGIEIGQRVLKWDTGLGKDHFAESLPQVGAFLELPFFEHFSLRVGHEETVKRNTLVMYEANSRVLTQNIIGDENYAASTKLSANYIDAIYNYTFWQNDTYKMNFLLFLGLSNGKLKLTNEDVTTASINERMLVDLTTAKKKYLRDGIGVQAIFNNGFGMQIKATQERTSKFSSNTTYHNVVDYNYSTQAKNSITFNLGITYQM